MVENQRVGSPKLNRTKTDKTAYAQTCKNSDAQKLTPNCVICTIIPARKDLTDIGTVYIIYGHGSYG